MHAKEIFGLCTVCVIFSLTNSLPLDTVRTKSGNIYQLVPLQVVSDGTFILHNLQRARRDVFSENVNGQKDERKKWDTVIVGATKRGDNGRVLNGANKEVLKTAADTIYPVVYRVRRGYDNRRGYEDSNDDDDDSDYAGYDRKGSDVGYMDDSDDFPTVVW